VLRITPLGPVETDQVVTWLVHEDAKEGIDYDIESLTWLHSATIGQDQKIAEDNQAGMSSSVYVPGPYTELESQIPEIHNDYIQTLRSGRALRSQQR
jgi:Rieske 2Fe-2S family protein